MTGNAGDLLEAVLPDLSTTIYERRAPLEAAPLKTDCLTSIHYLFSKALGIHIPLTFVGDMPRQLRSSGWDFHVVDIAELRSGDLLFLKRKEEPRLIIHAALVLSVDRIVHCKRDIGIVLESIDSVFEVYEQQIHEDQLIYIDYRNEGLREKYGGCYLEV